MPRVDGREFIDRVDKDIKEQLLRRMNEKGHRTFTSTHECFGVLAEEFNELSRALEENNTEEFEKECLDIAVAAIWALVSIKAGELDW